MKLTTILFDLDGTLLPMDNDEFTRGYFKLLAAKMAPLGYEPKRLVDAVWTGTAAMVKNDGSRSNETAFWQAFGQIYGDRAQADRPIFEAFYENEFQNARAICGFDPAAAQSVRELKRSGFGVDPAACLMVGNDVTEDMVARTLGMRVFLLTDHIINRQNEPIDRYPHGSFPELMAYIDRAAGEE